MKKMSVTSVAVFFSNLSCSSSSSPNPLNSSLLPFRKFLLPSSSSPVVYRRQQQQQHRFNGGFRTHFYSPPLYYRSISPVMEWQDCTVKMEIDVPISVAYSCYSDRQAIPRWMPFISSVKILEDKPDHSRWSLKYNAFGQDIEYSWLARNLQPIRNQKIHWRSLEGLPNRGAVRFYPKGASSCLVELTVSYEVPQLLAPVASALQPFLQQLLATGLERFAEFARSHSTDDSTM